MLNKFYSFLQHEQGLIKEMLSLAEMQQKALISYDTVTLERITLRQDKLSKSLRQSEEQRINLLITWLGLSRNEAINTKLSSLIEFVPKEEINNLLKFKDEFKILITGLNNMNTVNRVLTNRARNSIGEILSHFTNGTNHVCNVKI